MIELKQLYYLTVCAETRSFTRAAAVLFTAQSNVSKVIKSLEEELGFDLFERRQYGIALTPQGKKVYDQALITLGSARKIEDLAGSGILQELKISANPGRWMADAFCDYYLSHRQKDVKYSFVNAGTEEIISRLSDSTDQLGFICILESQLPLLQSRLEKLHLIFTVMHHTRVLLYPGKQTEYASGGDLFLVQGYDDAFSLRNARGEKPEKDQEQTAFHISVNTNNEYVTKTLLDRTELGHIEAAFPGTLDTADETSPMPLHSEETPVLFGCITRNDTNLDPLTLKFLSFVRQKLKEQL